MYTRLNHDLNEFLNTFEISSYTCDVFEEVILDKLASIKTAPIKCQFGPIDENVMYFKIKGISDSEANEFLNFFKQCGDMKAQKYYISKPKNNGNIDTTELYDAYVFNVSTDVVYNNIFRQFKRQIVELNENPTVRFLTYKQQSAEDDNVRIYKLLVLLDGILKQTGDLERNCVDVYTKGELHIIFKLLNDRLKLYKMHIPHECGRFENDVREKIALFEETFRENSLLHQDEAAIQLQQDLNKIQKAMPVPQAPGLGSFGLFKQCQATESKTEYAEHEHKLKLKSDCCKIV